MHWSPSSLSVPFATAASYAPNPSNHRWIISVHYRLPFRIGPTHLWRRNLYCIRIRRKNKPAISIPTRCRYLHRATYPRLEAIIQPPLIAPYCQPWIDTKMYSPSWYSVQYFAGFGFCGIQCRGCRIIKLPIILYITSSSTPLIEGGYLVMW